MPMKSDTLIKTDGMRILADTLGIVEAERFITLMLREPFNYTECSVPYTAICLPLKELYENIKTFETGSA